MGNKGKDRKLTPAEEKRMKRFSEISEKLEAEGVVFVDGHVDMERFCIDLEDFESIRMGLSS